MTSYVEIEKQYRVITGDIFSYLKNFSFQKSKRILDQYFDTVEGHYYQEGIFIRIRNDRSLDIKFNPDHLGQSSPQERISCHEYSFEEPLDNPLYEKKWNELTMLIKIEKPSGSSFEAFLTHNALKPMITLDKTRQTYQAGIFLVEVDEIKDVGTFLEVEYAGSPVSKEQIPSVLSTIDELVKEMPIEPVATGTFEAILRQRNFELYKKGKYL